MINTMITGRKEYLWLYVLKCSLARLNHTNYRASRTRCRHIADIYYTAWLDMNVSNSCWINARISCIHTENTQQNTRQQTEQLLHDWKCF